MREMHGVLLSRGLKAGLAHVQFETIHPFLDGNGRVGRLLITLLLCEAGMLRDPLLYLSLYFKQHRSTYYEILDRVRHDGDWEAWLAFFLAGVRETAAGAVTTASRLTAIFKDDRTRGEGMGRRAGSALRVHEALEAMRVLADAGIVRETTGRLRGRVFVYDGYLSVLSEGTERKEE
jgi:Fic family protein